MKKDNRLNDPVKYFNNWMRNILRTASYKWHERTVALQKARIERGIYLCAKCQNKFGNKEVRVDHISPVVDPKVGFVSWDVYITRLFCSATNLQILCKPCHQEKTNIERAERKAYSTAQFSLEARLKMSQIRKGHHDNLGIPKSPETKQAWSKARKGLPQTIARRKVQLQNAEQNKRPITAYNIETKEIRDFPSIKEAAQTLNIEEGNISRVCRNIQNRTQANGWVFKYQENRERRKRKVLKGIVCQHDDSSWCTESCPRGKIYE